MKEIKIRYVVEGDKGEIKFSEPLDIKTIEQNNIREGIHTKWEKIIARNLYTGLKDKNGKEIYEGDMVGSAHGNCEIWRDKFGWQPFLICFDTEPEFLDTKDVEVIGNIYTNPDLLEKSGEVSH